LTIPGTLSGFTILGSALQYEVAPTKPGFAWSNPNLKTTNPDPQADGTTVLMKTVNDATVSTRRAKILAKLNGGGLLKNPTVDVSRMAKSADDALLDAPQLMDWVPVT